MAKKIFSQHSAHLSKLQPHLKLIEYTGYKTLNSIFLDLEYGEFFGKYYSVLYGQTVHPNRSNKNKELSFEKLNSRLNKKYSFLTLKEYKGYNTKYSIFTDSEHGDFLGVYNNVFQGEKSHPLRKRQNIISAMNSESVINKIKQKKIKTGSWSISPARNNDRTNRLHNLFKKQVLKRDNYKCRKCFSMEKLVVHHLLSFTFYPSKRYDPENGIILCQKCHSLFHNMYGRITNDIFKTYDFLTKD